ncbi:uncharacterized protein [Labrus bergylta]|uniref:uncharacterized protein isoform X2 n=1 Tax=Labrus bergylta TaxID=56723 RepID=UPI0009B3876B|nr:uncharacterized protein LOC109992069 isoform X2 [Labrus bergylta]
MKADMWIFLLALCFTRVSSNDQNSCEQYSMVCEMHKLSASLGSSVLLPCNLRTSNITQVSWAQSAEQELVLFTSDGRIQFLEHKNGRVKAFPNQGSEGNYSIRIDELNESDLRCYLCTWEQDCLQVHLVAVKGTLSTAIKLLICACVTAAVFILLGIGGYFCMKCIRSNAPAETGRVPNVDHQKGAYDDSLVYENDDQDPANQQGDRSRNQFNLPAVQPDPDTSQPGQSTSETNQFRFVRMESQRTKRRFHTDLINRLRNSSLGRHYYANQGEISRQQAAQAENQNRADGRKKRAKAKSEYQNPIYNRSTDQLQQM